MARLTDQQKAERATVRQDRLTAQAKAWGAEQAAKAPAPTPAQLRLTAQILANNAASDTTSDQAGAS